MSKAKRAPINSVVVLADIGRYNDTDNNNKSNAIISLFVK